MHCVTIRSDCRLKIHLTFGIASRINERGRFEEVRVGITVFQERSQIRPRIARGAFGQFRPVPVPGGVEEIEERSQEDGRHRRQDEVAEGVLVWEDDDQEELDCLHDGVEGVLHPADRPPELLLDTLLRAMAM